jgi:transketolase
MDESLKAKNLDLNIIQKLSQNIKEHAINMTNSGKSSHIASVLSMADILAVLYGSIMNFRSNEPTWNNRDRFILSKGHAGAGVYAVLAEKNFIPKSKLNTHYKDGSDLSGHVSHKGIPGVEFSTGSLGHGLPVAAGMALAAKINKEKHRIFVLLGDGECDEGSNWEAALFSAHHKLDNLTLIIDRNKWQSIYTTEETLALEPFADKWKAFGWEVKDIDGHNLTDIYDALLQTETSARKPLCVIANTIKGKGVSFMEDNIVWHYRSPQNQEFDDAIKEIKDKNA